MESYDIALRLEQEGLCQSYFTSEQYQVWKEVLSSTENWARFCEVFLEPKATSFVSVYERLAFRARYMLFDLCIPLVLKKDLTQQPVIERFCGRKSRTGRYILVFANELFVFLMPMIDAIDQVYYLLEPDASAERVMPQMLLLFTVVLIDGRNRPCAYPQGLLTMSLTDQRLRL